MQPLRYRELPDGSLLLVGQWPELLRLSRETLAGADPAVATFTPPSTLRLVYLNATAVYELEPDYASPGDFIAHRRMWQIRYEVPV